MDYKSIVCFLRVCELHSFTKAAEDLYISQPALSRRILALEDELGVKLLVAQTVACSSQKAVNCFIRMPKSSSM